jgi:replicative DNA helicase
MSLTPLQWAEAYLARGLRPLPAARGTKFPRVPWTPYQEAPPSLEQVRAWWTETPEDGIALVVGAQSELLVVDLDGGEAAERLLTERGIHLPHAAPRVRTRHGWHVYLRSTVPVPDRIALFSSEVPKAQVDIRGQGIVIAPPSVHPSGHVYQWETPLPPFNDTPLPLAPPLLIDALRAQARASVSGGLIARDPAAEGWVSSALRNGAPEGQRNVTCARLAGYLLGKGLPEDVVETMLLGFAARCVPSLPDREVTRAVQSVARRERASGSTEVAGTAVHIGALVQAVKASYADGPTPFLETPLPTLNLYLEGGFSPGELIYVGARPGVGKSALALQVAKHAAERGSSVLVINAEMKNRMSAQRLLAQESRVGAGVIKRGTFSTDQWRTFEGAVQALSKLPIWFADDAYTLEQIGAIVGQATSLGLIVVDYLQLLKASAGIRERRHQVEDLSKGLQRLAHTYDVPVLALSSLSRPANGGAPSLASLRESGELEHDADTVLLLHRDEHDDTPYHQGKTELTIAKARSGRLGKIDLYFSGEAQTFAEAVM